MEEQTALQRRYIEVQLEEMSNKQQAKCQVHDLAYVSYSTHISCMLFHTGSIQCRYCCNSMSGTLGFIDKTSLPNVWASVAIRKHFFSLRWILPPCYSPEALFLFFWTTQAKELSLLTHPQAISPRFSLSVLQRALAESLSLGSDTLCTVVPTGTLAGTTSCGYRLEITGSV